VGSSGHRADSSSRRGGAEEGGGGGGGGRSRGLCAGCEAAGEQTVDWRRGQGGGGLRWLGACRGSRGKGLAQARRKGGSRGPPSSSARPRPRPSPHPLPPFFSLRRHELHIISPPPPRTRASSPVPCIPSAPAPANFPGDPHHHLNLRSRLESARSSRPLPRPRSRTPPPPSPSCLPARALTRSPGILLRSVRRPHTSARRRCHRRRRRRRHRGTEPLRVSRGPTPSTAQSHAPRSSHEYSYRRKPGAGSRGRIRPVPPYAKQAPRRTQLFMILQMTVPPQARAGELTQFTECHRDDCLERRPLWTALSPAQQPALIAAP
jgi:hypothetical protein